MQAIKGARAARGAEHGGRGGPRRVDLLCGFAGGEAKGSSRGNKRGHPSRIQEARTHGRWTGECEERTGNERNLSDEGGQQGREQGQARSKASAELLIAWLVVVGECEVDELLSFRLSQF